MENEDKELIQHKIIVQDENFSYLPKKKFGT